METKNQRKFKWFWPWQDQMEEEWLREMARSGWHLQKVEWPGWYSFAQGEPADVVYRLDYNSEVQKDKEHYLQIFRDAGWEPTGEMNGWYYFRKLAEPGKKNEIFTDPESKIQKYKRFLDASVVWLPIWLIFVTALNNSDRPVLYTAIWGFFIAVNILVAVIYVKVYRRIDELKKL